MLSLKDVTICSIDCITPDLSAEAIKISTKNIDFGDSILFSDRLHSGNFRSIEIAPLKSKNDYSRFVIQDLVEHIKTKFVLIVQWDGYVTNPNAWVDEFLDKFESYALSCGRGRCMNMCLGYWFIKMAYIAKLN